MDTTQAMQNDHNYRMEGRNKLDYYKDIVEGTKKEARIVKQYGKILKRETGRKAVIHSNGCSNEGKLLRYDQISVAPDFVVNDKLIEVKSSTVQAPVLHFKCDQLKQYLKKYQCDILFVNGVDTEDTVYTIITPQDMKAIIKGFREYPKYKVGDQVKTVYKVQADRFNWKPFN